MFFQVCKHQLDRLLPQPVDRFGACGLHPGLMRQDECFVFAPPKTATDFVACRAWRPERARLARGGLDPVAYDDFLTASTPPTRFASHALEQMSRWTPRGLQLREPLALGLREQSEHLGRTDVMRFPGPVQGHLCLGTEG
jgi:hypothetical protein